MTDNAIVNIKKKRKRQTMVGIAQHRKLKIEKHEPHYKKVKNTDLCGM